MKKLVIILGSLVALLMVAVAVVPFFVDVDEYRPEIVRRANESLNGQLELGKLSLSLWGQVRIGIEGLKLTDAEGRVVVQVQDASFRMPYSSIFAGSPTLVLQMQNPELSAVKDKKGKLNVLALAKTTARSAPEAAPEAPSAAATPAPAPNAAHESTRMKLPGIVSAASLGIELEHAKISYRDELSGMSSQFSDLKISLQDISLSHTMSIEISAKLDTELKSASGGKGLSVKGPAVLKGTATPLIAGGRFDHLDFSAHADLDRLDIEMPENFHKKPGVAANADAVLSVSSSEAVVTRLDAKFFNATLESSGKVTHLGEGEQPVVVYHLKTNQIVLKSWVELVPMLREYELGGTAILNAEANGPSDRLVYKAVARIEGLTAKAPHLKGQPRFDADLTVVPDKANLTATMKAAGNDVSLNGDLVSFTHPLIRLDISSTGMDLDQLIDFPTAPKTAAVNAAAVAPGTPVSAAPADYDALVAPIRENKSLTLAVAHLNANIRSIKYQGVIVSDFVAKTSLQSLIGAIDSLQFKVFSGQVKSSASVDLKPKMPDYRLSLSVAGLDIQQAVDSEMKLFKNTVLGKVSFELTGSGKGLNPEPAKKNLEAKGKFRVDNATFTTIDIAKMVVDAINGAIAKASDKVPLLKGKSLPEKLPSGGSRYDFISGTFSIAGGTLSLPDFVAKASPSRGIDLKGATTVGLVDQSLSANWQVIDTYNLTRAKDLSIDVMGNHADHLLAQGNGPVQFPLSVGGTLTSPRYNYGPTTEYLAKVAIGNAANALGKGATSKILDKIQGQAPPALQNALKNLGGKLFGN